MADLPALPTDEQAEKLKQGGFLPQGFSFNPMGGVIGSPSDSTISLNPMGGVIIGNNPPAADTASVAPTAFTPMNNGQPLPAPGTSHQVTPIPDGGLVGDLSNKAQIPTMPALPTFNDYGIGAAGGMVKDALNLGDKQGIAKAAEMNRVLDENDKRIAATALKRADDQKEIDNYKTGLDSAVNELSSFKVDNDRFWKNKSTGDKILAGIGMFLGAFGTAGNGGVNQAASVVRSAIKDDIEAQKADYEAKKDSVTAKRTVFGDMMTRFKDKYLAEDATNVASLNNAMLRVQARTEQFGNPELKLKGAQIYGQLASEKSQAETNFLQRVAAKQAIFSQMNSSPETATIAKILDKDDHENAIKELTGWHNAQENIKLVENDFNKIKKLSLSDRLNPAGSDAADLGTINANIFSYVKQAIGEKMSDADAKELVRPFQISKVDLTDARLDAKMKGLQRLIQSKALTPTLRRYGVAPKPLEEKLGVQQGLAK